MALHRDIHWIGRQWAVTGRGMQLIDQKLKGFFDIEVSQLWYEALIETTRAKEWLNVADFDKGLEVARKRYKDPPPAVALPEALIEQAAPIARIAPLVTAPPIGPTAPVIVSIKPLAAAPAPEQIANPAEPPPQTPETIKAEKPPLGKFHMRYLGSAKFIRPWRVRMKK